MGNTQNIVESIASIDEAVSALEMDVSPIETLPPEIHMHILHYMPPRDIFLNVSCVCGDFHEIVCSEPGFWYSLVFAHLRSALIRGPGQEGSPNRTTIDSLVRELLLGFYSEFAGVATSGPSGIIMEDDVSHIFDDEGTTTEGRSVSSPDETAQKIWRLVYIHRVFDRVRTLRFVPEWCFDARTRKHVHTSLLDSRTAWALPDKIPRLVIPLNAVFREWGSRRRISLRLNKNTHLLSDRRHSVNSVAIGVYSVRQQEPELVVFEGEKEGRGAKTRIPEMIGESLDLRYPYICSGLGGLGDAWAMSLEDCDIAGIRRGNPFEGVGHYRLWPGGGRDRRPQKMRVGVGDIITLDVDLLDEEKRQTLLLRWYLNGRLVLSCQTGNFRLPLVAAASFDGIRAGFQLSVVEVGEEEFSLAVGEPSRSEILVPVSEELRTDTLPFRLPPLLYSSPEEEANDEQTGEEELQQQESFFDDDLFLWMRTNLMDNSEVRPWILKDPTIEGLRSAFVECLGISYDEIWEVRKCVEVRRMFVRWLRVTKNASVLGMAPHTLVVAVVGDEEDE